MAIRIVYIIISDPSIVDDRNHQPCGLAGFSSAFLPFYIVQLQEWKSN